MELSLAINTRSGIILATFRLHLPNPHKNLKPGISIFCHCLNKTDFLVLLNSRVSRLSLEFFFNILLNLVDIKEKLGQKSGQEFETKGIQIRLIIFQYCQLRRLLV